MKDYGLNSNGAFRGELYRVAVYDRALSLGELDVHAALPGTPSALPNCTSCFETAFYNPYFRNCSEDFAAIDWGASYIFAEEWPDETIAPDLSDAGSYHDYNIQVFFF